MPSGLGKKMPYRKPRLNTVLETMGSQGTREQRGLMYPGRLEKDKHGLAARGEGIPGVNTQDRQKLLHELVSTSSLRCRHKTEVTQITAMEAQGTTTAASLPTRKVSRAVEDLNAFLERRRRALAGAEWRAQLGIINTVTADTSRMRSRGPACTHSFGPYTATDSKDGRVPPFLDRNTEAAQC